MDYCEKSTNHKHVKVHVMQCLHWICLCELLFIPSLHTNMMVDTLYVIPHSLEESISIIEKKPTPLVRYTII
jgi:hypothetical protein